ncbi:cytosine-specific methyltransferase [Actinomadura sp. NBRC 104412]|uniref:DNA cytosine methyltransferase n=1 Tax=Actinomadura sp. NBRC 104412 TaxID=3032203 RepID=UPI0024A1B2CA|nr:DNA cytosine methyltransferase [Actinomadura sp. NBRC 104412]GLZ08905.1 cytosine-specific methyltransferase [Actinomadura sp. NBRC 104412]
MTTSPTSTINVIDLFAGCGGFTQGFREFTATPQGRESPFRTVGAVEVDIAAASTYAVNFADEAGGTDHIFAGDEQGDVTKWDPGQVEADVDVILGGPPCQGFSGLGKAEQDDPRNKLWRDYMRVVNALHPKVFVMENVDRFFGSPEYKELRRTLQEATERPDGQLRDYHLESGVLNAADYGVPQARRRTIILATRRDLIAEHPEKRPLVHPKATHRKPEASDKNSLIEVDDIFPPWVAARTVFEMTPKETSTTALPDRVTAPLGHDVPGSFKTTDLHIGRNPRPLSLARYAAIPEGGNRHDLPPELSTDSWLNHRSGSGDVMGRMYWDKPSVTIRTEFYKPEKGRYLHPSENRPITHLEAALLQGFPRDFLWCGSKIQIARQIGNAVPVGLSRAIAGQVYAYLEITGQVRRPTVRKTA